MKTQVCSKCTKEKPLTEEFFKRTKLLSTGFYKTCKKCCAQYAPNYGRNAQMKSRYKLTPEQYDVKLQSQEGVCEICGAKPSIQKRRFSVDHDHKCCAGQKSCGKCLRSILCSDCNRKIGFLENILGQTSSYIKGYDGSWLQKALQYLQVWQLRLSKGVVVAISALREPDSSAVPSMGKTQETQ